MIRVCSLRDRLLIERDGSVRSVSVEQYGPLIERMLERLDASGRVEFVGPRSFFSRAAAAA